MKNLAVEESLLSLVSKVSKYMAVGLRCQPIYFYFCVLHISIFNMRIKNYNTVFQ